MIKKPLKKKRGRPKKVKVPEKQGMTFSSTTPLEVSKPSETKVLPIIEGSQALEIIQENENAIHYRMANGTTLWQPKQK